jgi:xanthine/CO dehydrogenase XdhC/CoxF family maturation factor
MHEKREKGRHDVIIQSFNPDPHAVVFLLLGEDTCIFHLLITTQDKGKKRYERAIKSVRHITGGREAAKEIRALLLQDIRPKEATTDNLNHRTLHAIPSSERMRCCDQTQRQRTFVVQMTGMMNRDRTKQEEEE